MNQEKEDSDELKIYKILVSGIIRQNKDQLVKAENIFREAILLSENHKILKNKCYELITENLYLQWTNQRTSAKLVELEKNLDHWQQFCENNSITIDLIKIYLLKSKLLMSMIQIDSAEIFLNKSRDLALKGELKRYLKLISYEEENLRYLTSLGIGKESMIKKQLKSEPLDDFNKYLLELLDLLGEK